MEGVLVALTASGKEGAKLLLKGIKVTFGRLVVTQYLIEYVF